MTANELLQTLRRAITEERAAIRELDVVAIERANATKDDVLRRLREASPSKRPPLYAALDELKVDLRCNLVLMTHARAYLREAELAAAHEKSTATTLSPPSRARQA